MTKYLSTLLTLVLALIVFNANGQKRIMVQAVDAIEGKKMLSLFTSNSSSQALKVVPPYCINFFANNKNFSVIDRQNLSLISQEKELQKSESFIDGYIVDQGKSEGADYVLKGLYLENEKTLNLKIYDVASETVLCSKDEVMQTNILGIKNLEARIYNMLHQMLFDCFDIKYSVVRILEAKKDNARTVLVAIGKKHKIHLKDRVEFYYFVEEDIDGEKVNRKVFVGEGEIQDINDDNFSAIKINKEGKAINNALQEGKKLFVLINNQI